MTIRYFSLLLLTLITLTLFASDVSAGILDNITGKNKIENVSITVGTPNGTTDVVDASKDFGFRILTAVRLLISGFAIIYIVLIGAYMVVYSENEDRIKNQKNQITYALVAFLFLNIPGMLYTAFFEGSSKPGNNSIGDTSPFDFLDLSALTGSTGVIGMIIGFFEIFIFGVAILTFTWGFFRFIIAGGNEEVQKKSRQKIIYGILGLIFLGFVRLWGSIIAQGSFFGEFATVGNKFLGLALYFAAPVVVFFLVLGSYYYITSGGDEERTKKAKAIFVNTLIAALILLGAYSFLYDLVNFTL